MERFWYRLTQVHLEKWQLNQRSTVSLQCFDTVDWMTGRASGLYSILHQQSSEDLLWETVRGRCLTWSDLRNNWPVEQKLKVTFEVLML